MDEEYESSERTLIREELSEMSFEELAKLKEELGSKVYNEAIFGTTKRVNKKQFKRENKNRPREMSSKHPVPTTHITIPVKKIIPRDPRFDSLCGEFDRKRFSKSYSFLKDVKEEELKVLKTELTTETNPQRKKELKYLIQRMENQQREKSNLTAKFKKKEEQQNKEIEMLKQGIKPRYIKKSDKKVLELLDQYEDLKKSGRLEKHLQKKRKKQSRKEKKKMFSERK